MICLERTARQRLPVETLLRQGNNIRAFSYFNDRCNLLEENES
jgi:hypothetical protein